MSIIEYKKLINADMIKHLRTTIFIALSTVMSCTGVFGQQEINVNPAKGLMTVNIPLYTLEVPGFKLPIGLTYAARGYKINEDYRSFTGWNFQGAGVVRRILRGLPDEYQEPGDSRRGWMYNSSYTVPLSFTPADDGDENNCTDEGTNYTWLNANYTSDKDLQPDVFVVEAPGLSCRLMMDNQGAFRAIPAQDLKIEFNVVAWNNMNFVITTNNGIKYTFDLRSVANKEVTPSANNYDLFREEANNYSYNMVYFDAWYLTKIEVLNSGRNHFINYSYNTGDNYTHGTEELKVFIKNNAVDTARENKLYEWNRWSVNRRRVTAITTSIGTKAVFEGESEIPSAIKIYYGLESGRAVDRGINIYDRQGYDGNHNARSFLTNVQFYGQGCAYDEYKFSYYGFAEYGDPGPSTQFPVDPDSKQVDAWGYYNGNGTSHQAPKIYVYPALRNTTGIYRPYAIPGYSGTYYVLPGNDLTPNENKISYGSMSKITYPAGGSSSFEYESNSFLDEDANAEVKGGGIRIKAINHFDGLNTGSVMRKEFIYKTDAGITSGKINMLPAYAISTTSYKDLIAGTTKSYATILSTYGANSLDYWNYLTVRTKHDLYMGESMVSYTQVTSKESGNGRVKQVFSPSKSFWDTSTSILSYAAESCYAGNSPFIVKGYNQYPFAPIEHSEGGNLMEEYVYNEAGNLLKKRELEYENYHNTPQRIYAVVRDNNFGLRQLSKYYTEIGGTVLKKAIETVYDSNLTGNSLVTQTEYDNSAFNRKVKSSLVTNSDNTQIRTNYLYSGDFSGFHTNDQFNPYLRGLMTLLYSNNVRDEILEQTTELKAIGGSFKVVVAQSNLYDRNTVGGQDYAVLKEVKSIRNLSGLSDFSPMQRIGTVPSRSLSIDSRYKDEQVFSDYNNALLAGTVTQKRAKVAIVSDSLLRRPMLQVNGAELADIGFYNFDNEDNNSLYFYGVYWADYFKDPYFGRYIRFAPGQEFYKNLTRKTENKFYKLAFLARTDTATQVNFMINDVVVATVAISVSDKFKFYEKMIDVSSIATTGWVKITTNGNIYLDNLLFYPADAQFAMVNYDKVYGKTMEMNSSGAAKLYEYANERLATERDLQGNIVKASFYAKQRETAVIPYYASITVVNPTKTYVGRVMKFRGAGSCLPGTKYIWNFGDGTTLESYDQNVTHVYASASNYTVSLTLSHPEYTNHTSTESLLIRAAPVVTAGICASGIIRINTCYDYIKYYNDCNPWIPGEIDSPYGTKFTAWGMGCPTGTYTYKWEISYDGIEYYDIGPYATDQMLEMSMYEYYMDTYIRCRISAVDCDAVVYTEPVFIEANCDVY